MGKSWLLLRAGRKPSDAPAAIRNLLTYRRLVRPSRISGLATVLKAASRAFSPCIPGICQPKGLAACARRAGRHHAARRDRYQGEPFDEWWRATVDGTKLGDRKGDFSLDTDHHVYYRNIALRGFVIPAESDGAWVSPVSPNGDVLCFSLSKNAQGFLVHLPTMTGAKV